MSSTVLKGRLDVTETGEGHELTTEAIPAPLEPSKKKKKKTKKRKPESAAIQQDVIPAKSLPPPPAPVLRISRNKHWKYISSYHGPWLNLPHEILESLLTLNLDPGISHPYASGNNTNDEPIAQKFHPMPEPHSPSPRIIARKSQSGRPIPPPIDPGIFRSVFSIRKLIDEASELAIRASSGLSAAALGSQRSPFSGASPQNPWASAQSLGISEQQNGGRKTTMSPLLCHRLRVMAIQKLATAYKMDEIATSVLVMQGSALDDVAEKVLKTDPSNQDALYVNFFHERIESSPRSMCGTTTELLDQLIQARPQYLEYWRTRGIIHCFRDDPLLAVKDFTYALSQARALRKSRNAWVCNDAHSKSSKKGKKVGGKKKQASRSSATKINEFNNVDDDDGCTTAAESAAHPSLLINAPEPIEPQLLFYRGAAYLQHVILKIESTILDLEGVQKSPPEAVETKLSDIENGRYGGVEGRNPHGPLGPLDGEKLKAYQSALDRQDLKDEIYPLLRKCIRDHERFLGHFDTLEDPAATNTLAHLNVAQRVEHGFYLTEALRPGSQTPFPIVPSADGDSSEPGSASTSPKSSASTKCPPLPSSYTTYHPLLIESHFNILLALLLLGEFSTLLGTFIRSATLIDGFEGYPVFLAARSISQAEYVEVLERLVGCWKVGLKPHSLAGTKMNGALAITATGEDEDDKKPSPSTEQLSSLDSLRMILAPVLKRQRERIAQRIADANNDGSKSKVPIQIPLHGPRVEIILAWLGAVHLPAMEHIERDSGGINGGASGSGPA